jgi:anti-sigma regulatory factor (Ser/Thr protein kinase)
MGRRARREAILFRSDFRVRGGDFGRAGRASTEMKSILRDLGFDPQIVRRAAICTYEAEMNVVMYADRAEMVLSVTPHEIVVTVRDRGPGIEDIDLAMQEGYSTATDEMREMGFGAGMGLPNIRKHADDFEIDSVAGSGTELRMGIGYHHRARSDG